MFAIRCRNIAGMVTGVLLMLSACSPVVNLPGKQTGEPKLEQERYVAVDGTLLPVRSWLPGDSDIKAVLVALHGFNDYSNAFSAPGEYLSRRGIACYAYDQRGFGEAPGRGLWAGTEAYTGDLAGFTAAVRQRHPGLPLYILGESMGGAVTIAAMTGGNPPRADGAILVAPAVWGRDSMPWYQRWALALTSRTVPWMTLSGKGLNIVPSDNTEMRRALGRDPLVIKDTRVDAMYGLTNLMDEASGRGEYLRIPAIVLYGKRDQVIPKEPTLRMLEKMPASTRKAFYDNGYHMLLRDLQAEKPLADIVAWISDRNAPLPFGSGHW